MIFLSCRRKLSRNITVRLKKIMNIRILSPKSLNCHHHKTTNIKLSSTPLSPNIYIRFLKNVNTDKSRTGLSTQLSSGPDSRWYHRRGSKSPVSTYSLFQHLFGLFWIHANLRIIFKIHQNRWKRWKFVSWIFEIESWIKTGRRLKFASRRRFTFRLIFINR